MSPRPAPRSSSRRPSERGFALLMVLYATAPHLMPDNYWLRIYSMAGIYVMLALGLNVVAGFAGLLDLAYVAFFGIGGYTFALLSSGQFDIHLPFILVVPVNLTPAVLCPASDSRRIADAAAVVFPASMSVPTTRMTTGNGPPALVSTR